MATPPVQDAGPSTGADRQDFARRDLAVRIKSDVLGGAEIWLASNADVRERLTAEGLSPVFLPEELPLLRGLASDDLRRICEIKRVFPGAKVFGDSGPVLPGAGGPAA